MPTLKIVYDGMIDHDDLRAALENTGVIVHEIYSHPQVTG